MPDELRSAYAVLGLQPGASLHKVKRQFKTLVRRWHPDRFLNDPQGKAEANDRLRVINIAYSTILQTGFGEAIPQVPRDPPAYASGGQAADPTPPRPVAPLTREQIDALIDAMRGHRVRKPIREQILEDPWNRGLSLALVCAYVLVDIIQTWRHPWPRIAMRGIRPALPATAPVLASVVGSVIWTLLALGDLVRRHRVETRRVGVSRPLRRVSAILPVDAATVAGGRNRRRECRECS